MFSPPSSSSNRRSARVGRATTVSQRRTHHGSGQVRLEKAQKWIQVPRPPAPGVEFTIPTWVPVSQLTPEEAQEHLPKPQTTEPKDVAPQSTADEAMSSVGGDKADSSSDEVMESSSDTQSQPVVEPGPQPEQPAGGLILSSEAKHDVVNSSSTGKAAATTQDPSSHSTTAASVTVRSETKVPPSTTSVLDSVPEEREILKASTAPTQEYNPPRATQNAPTMDLASGMEQVQDQTLQTADSNDALGNASGPSAKEEQDSTPTTMVADVPSVTTTAVSNAVDVPSATTGTERLEVTSSDEKQTGAKATSVLDVPSTAIPATDSMEISQTPTNAATGISSGETIGETATKNKTKATVVMVTATTTTDDSMELSQTKTNVAAAISSGEAIRETDTRNETVSTGVMDTATTTTQEAKDETKVSHVEANAADQEQIQSPPKTTQILDASSMPSARETDTDRTSTIDGPKDSSGTERDKAIEDATVQKPILPSEALNAQTTAANDAACETEITQTPETAKRVGPLEAMDDPAAKEQPQNAQTPTETPPVAATSNVTEDPERTTDTTGADTTLPSVSDQAASEEQDNEMGVATEPSKDEPRIPDSPSPMDVVDGNDQAGVAEGSILTEDSPLQSMEPRSDSVMEISNAILALSTPVVNRNDVETRSPEESGEVSTGAYRAASLVSELGHDKNVNPSYMMDAQPATTNHGGVQTGIGRTDAADKQLPSTSAGLDTTASNVGSENDATPADRGDSWVHEEEERAAKRQRTEM